tara:strand:+ start:98 stop:532 length:435 start_codon:yes stop_codon:yes gene_type:complete
MPLVGGGGAPNVSGGTNPAGIGNTLNIIGDYAYCYTGNHAANQTAVEAMKFTTGNYIFKGTLQANMGTQNAGVGTSTAVTIAQTELNGSIVSHIIAGNAGADSLTSVDQPLLLAPYTEVVVKLRSNEDEVTRFMTATLTGRIYA